MAREPGASSPGPLSPYVTLGAVRYAVRRAPPPRVCPCRCCSEEAVAACLGRAKPDRRTLERLRPRLGRSARDERPSRHQRLQDLTKRLLPRGNSAPPVSLQPPPPPPPPPPPHSAPVLPPVPPPRSRHRHSPPRGLSVDRCENDIFDTESITLPRVESRLIVGSYAQKTIPFRSASFSHGDCTQEKYYRATNRLPSIFDFGSKTEKTGVARAGSSCTRNDESVSLATEETVTEGGSVASVDSAVGSDEGLLAHASPAPRSPPPDAPHKQLGTRSLTHPLPRRVPPVREEDSTVAGGSLPVLMAPRVLHELREESDGSQADSAQAHSEGTSPLEPAQPFAFPPLPDPPPNACVNVDCECENFAIDRWEDPANKIASTIPVPVYECIVKQWSKELPPDDLPRSAAASDGSLDKDKEDETITREKVAHLLEAVKNTNTPVSIGIRERRRPLHDKKRRKGIYITTASDDGGEESPPVNGCKRENSDASLQEMRLSAETRTSSILGDKSDDSCANGPPSPCEAPAQMWPRADDLRTRRARFSQQSSDERDEDSFLMRRKYGVTSRGDSPSEAESDSCSRDRTASPSPFTPSDNSDVETKRQQFTKGPYGRNLEPPATRSVEVGRRSFSDATVTGNRKISAGAAPTVGSRPKGPTHVRATSSPSKLAGVRPGADLLAELLQGSSEALSNTATFDNVILTMHQHNAEEERRNRNHTDTLFRVLAAAREYLVQERPMSHATSNCGPKYFFALSAKKNREVTAQVSSTEVTDAILRPRRRISKFVLNCVPGTVEEYEVARYVEQNVEVFPNNLINKNCSKPAEFVKVIKSVRSSDRSKSVSVALTQMLNRRQNKITVAAKTTQTGGEVVEKSVAAGAEAESLIAEYKKFASVPISSSAPAPLAVRKATATLNPFKKARVTTPTTTNTAATASSATASTSTPFSATATFAPSDAASTSATSATTSTFAPSTAAATLVPSAASASAPSPAIASTSAASTFAPSTAGVTFAPSASSTSAPPAIATTSAAATSAAATASTSRSLRQFSMAQLVSTPAHTSFSIQLPAQATRNQPFSF